MLQSIRNIHTKCDRKRKFLFLTHNKLQDHTHVSPVKTSSVNKLLWLLVISVFKFSLSINVPSFLHYSSLLLHMHVCACTHKHTHTVICPFKEYMVKLHRYIMRKDMGTNMHVRYHQLRILSAKELS